MILLQQSVEYTQYIYTYPSESLREFIKQHKITREELDNYLQLFIDCVEEDIKAEEVTGYKKLEQVRIPVRMLLAYAVYSLFTGAVITGRRDVLDAKAVMETDPEQFAKKCLGIDGWAFPVSKNKLFLLKLGNMLETAIIKIKKIFRKLYKKLQTQQEGRNNVEVRIDKP
jgi:hypothetical protein